MCICAIVIVVAVSVGSWAMVHISPRAIVTEMVTLHLRNMTVADLLEGG